MGGDLNAKILVQDQEGGSVNLNHRDQLLLSQIEHLNLFDIPPPSFSNTWTNKRQGEGTIKSRLDRFLVGEKFSTIWQCQSQIRNWLASYHFLVQLNIQQR